MRNILGAAVLVLALCGPAFAGDILCPPAPTPAPATYQAGPVLDGETDTVDASDSLSEAVVDVLEVVLALL